MYFRCLQATSNKFLSRYFLNAVFVYSTKMVKDDKYFRIGRNKFCDVNFNIIKIKLPNFKNIRSIIIVFRIYNT